MALRRARGGLASLRGDFGGLLALGSHVAGGRNAGLLIEAVEGLLWGAGRGSSVTVRGQ